MLKFYTFSSIFNEKKIFSTSRSEGNCQKIGFSVGHILHIYIYIHIYILLAHVQQHTIFGLSGTNFMVNYTYLYTIYQRIKTITLTQSHFQCISYSKFQSIRTVDESQTHFHLYVCLYTINQLNSASFEIGAQLNQCLLSIHSTNTHKHYRAQKDIFSLI